MKKGNFEEALTNFTTLEGRKDSSHQLISPGKNLFNIGQMYLALGRMDLAAKAFEESIEKDKMSAVAHFMLGNVNLALNRNERALKNFSDATLHLRGNKLINYRQLGLKAELYLCEILVNRAITHSRLGDVQEARNDFLMALQSKVEPRHRIIEDLLLCWQSGQCVEYIKLPSNAVFQPSKKDIDALNGNCNFVEKSKVIAEVKVRRFPTSRSRPAAKQPPSSTPSKAVVDEQLPEQHLLQAEQAASRRHALLNDLRKQETRRSLKKVPSRTEPPKKPLPGFPQRAESPRRPPPSPRDFPTQRSGAEYLSPFTCRKKAFGPITPPSAANTRPRSPIDMGPPSKPLAPFPRPKSPLPSREIPSPAQCGKGRNVTLVLTRSVKVDESASIQDLLRAAANTFELSEDSFTLWCLKNNQLTALQDQDLENLLRSPADSNQKVFCYLNKPE